MTTKRSHTTRYQITFKFIINTTPSSSRQTQEERNCISVTNKPMFHEPMMSRWKGSGYYQLGQSLERNFVVVCLFYAHRVGGMVPWSYNLLRLVWNMFGRGLNCIQCIICSHDSENQASIIISSIYRGHIKMTQHLIFLDE